jgi:pyruvate/2-oxoacid:ferredoxin oxidoreductase beta subunit
MLFLMLNRIIINILLMKNNVYSLTKGADPSSKEVDNSNPSSKLQRQPGGVFIYNLFRF